MFDFKNQDVTGDYFAYTRAAAKATTSTASSGTAPKYYKVRKGDTLSRIATQHRVSLSRLLALNGLKKTSTLVIGKTLRLQ
jgi:LysM repeat protein